MEQTPPTIATKPTMAMGDEARFEVLAEEDIKTDHSPPSLPTSDPTSTPPIPTPQPLLPSTESSNMAVVTQVTTKKKGTAATVKRVPKRPKNGPSRAHKKAKSEHNTDDPDAGSEEDESDHGPYCICRGPDDHRWMICCEKCEDWFHGECININKDIGESLIEKFICPLCTSDNLVTLYKKTCALNGCRKPSRLSQDDQSVFCSNEHAQTWWERLVGRLPKTKGKGGFSDQLVQEEFMALLKSGLAGVDDEGMWRLARTPFSNVLSQGTSSEAKSKEDQLFEILSDEEKEFLATTENARFHLAEETILCHKMLNLIELAQDRRRAAITAGRFGEDICGYDQRLDTVCARDAFAAFTKTAEGEAIFKAARMGDPAGEEDAVRGMCERKRCKVHSGWQKMLVLGIKHQIREMAGQAAEVAEEERVVREAAGERWGRKKAESNWVEELDVLSEVFFGFRGSSIMKFHGVGAHFASSGANLYEYLEASTDSLTEITEAEGTTARTTAKTTATVSNVSIMGPFPTAYPPLAGCYDEFSLDFIVHLDYASTCLPKDFNHNATAYYSPGTGCPTGYTAQPSCTRSVEVGTTTVTCCPVRDSLTMACVTDANLLNEAWVDQFCTWSAGNKETVILVTGTNSEGVTFTGASTMSGSQGVNAYGLRMIYEPSDLAKETGTTATAAKTTTQTSATSTSTENSSGKASNTTAIAVGVAVPVVVIVAALFGAFFWWRRRKQRYGAVNSSSKDAHLNNDLKEPTLGRFGGELHGSQHQPLEMPVNEAPLELPADVPQDRVQGGSDIGSTRLGR
ncbi:hypothetical protein G7046_g8467 [Stylonectria norvegica]|nr:hypothetical protein G7046_g8467 [Stylonectria norvegica]